MQTKRKSKARPGGTEQKPAAARFTGIRLARRAETEEDYVEAIADFALKRSEGGAKVGARVRDLAAMMGVSHVTVVRTVARLAVRGLVATERGRPVVLTPAGRALAERSRERHRVVLEFLRAIGVERGQAEIDAEGIEHHVSEATIRAMRRVIRAKAAG